jgi:glycolate oxidase iron-sulfur subunit
MKLDLNPDELAACVSCGLCLPHCPTFRATGEEALSPRGRIDAMRSVQLHQAPADDQFVHFMETCVQCRGCEPACPSAVPFGRLMEGTRVALAAQGRITPWWQRLGYRILRHHGLVLAGSSLLAAAQRARLVPSRLGVPALPLRRGPKIRSTGEQVWLFTGCVMDAWQRETHRSTASVLDAMGVSYSVAHKGAACCGALHVHAGLDAAARQLAHQVMSALPGQAPILVNSAGCGAALKEYGHLIGSQTAIGFSARVFDVHEWIGEHIDLLPEPRRQLGAVIVQDPCHLRHVQRAHLAVRTVMSRVAEVIELDDDGLCCGAGGAYSALQPDLAGQLRDRKLMAIQRAVERSQASIVASANPGCLLHLHGVLAQHDLAVRHPIDLLAEALR